MRKRPQSKLVTHMKRVMAVILAAFMLIFAACAPSKRQITATKAVESDENGIVEQVINARWADEETLEYFRYTFKFSDEAKAKQTYDELAEVIGDNKGYDLKIEGSSVSYNEVLTDATAARPYSSLYGQLTADGWTIVAK